VRYTRRMLRARTAWLPAAAAAAAVAVVVALLLVAGGAGTRTAGAQDRVKTLVVSGLQIGVAKSPHAWVRIRNCTKTESFTVHYTVQSVDGEPLSAPGAGPSGVVLFAGRTLDLDLGAVVAQYRAQFEAGPFTGPARLVAYGEGGIFETFGPETIHVSAHQVEAPAKFEPMVEWR